MTYHSTDAVVVRLVEAVKELEAAAHGAAEYLEKATDAQNPGAISPLRKMVMGALKRASLAAEVARQNFRYGHDCATAKCDSDSHK